MKMIISAVRWTFISSKVVWCFLQVSKQRRAPEDSAGLWCGGVQRLREFNSAAGWRSDLGNYRWLPDRWLPSARPDSFHLSNPIWRLFPSFKTALHAETKNSKWKKMFILISTVMTWARIKPQEAVTLTTNHKQQDSQKPSQGLHVFLLRTAQNPFSSRKSSDDGGLIPASGTTTIWKNWCWSWQQRWLMIQRKHWKLE